MMGMYGLFLAAALAAGSAVFFVLSRRAGIPAKVTPVLAVLSALLGGAGARLYFHLARNVVNGFALGRFALLSTRPYEYAMCGALLGVLLAGVLTAKLVKRRVYAVLDALAPAGLLALAVARFGEHFSDFGWGQIVDNPFWHFFPVCTPDLYEQWHLAVYMLEGVLALAVFAYALRCRGRGEGDRFYMALLLFAASQVPCESLRAETIRWGFVRVQQLQCAVFMLGVLIVYVLRACRAGRGWHVRTAGVVFVLGIGAVVFAEYALDKIDALSAPVCYAIMTAALIAMCTSIVRVRMDAHGETNQ